MLTIDDVASLTGLSQAAQGMKLRTSAGIDGISLAQFREGLEETWLGEDIIDSLKNGSYRPKPLRRKTLPKPNGTYRDIFVPTVQDRAAQRMLVSGLNKVTEPRFSEHSYGFRPKRNTQQAIAEAKGYVKNGLRVTYLIDLSNFFGNIDRERLRKLLRDYSLDEQIRNLINQFIKAPIIDCNKSIGTTGVPAGIPLAPLLANIYLHPLDRELERRQIAFIRYADDITLFFKDEHTIESFSNTEFLGTSEQRYGIRLNCLKTKLIATGHRPILGFHLHDDGRVTFSPKVLDAIQYSLLGLLASPKIQLTQIKETVKSVLSSILAYYKSVDNFDELKQRCDLIQESLRALILDRETPLAILFAAKWKIDRLEDIEPHVELDAIFELLPSVETYSLCA